MFRFRKVKRLEDKNGRREWVRENGLRWDGWDALASKLWLRRVDTGRVDDEGRPVFESVDLMEEFFENIHRQVQESCK